MLRFEPWEIHRYAPELAAAVDKGNFASMQYGSLKYGKPKGKEHENWSQNEIVFYNPFGINESKLLSAIDENFDLEEVRTLCFVTKVDFDNLRGEGKISKARELIIHCQRIKKLGPLFKWCVDTRPDFDWMSCLSFRYRDERYGRNARGSYP